MAWATALSHNVFLKARLRLTMYYVLFMVIIIGLFSTILLSEIDKNMRAAYRRHMVRNELFVSELPRTPIFLAGMERINKIYEQDFNDASRAIKTLVLTVDAMLLVLIGGASYVLAGRTLKPIKRALDDQKRFVADVSHDLRTPLAIMKTETEVALQDSSSQTAVYRGALTSNLEEIDKMSLLVSDLLLLARTEGVYQYVDQNQAGHSENLDFGAFVEKICDKMSKQASMKGIALELKKDAGKALFAQAHVNHLERAIQNVIQNAINYTPEKGSIKVSLSDTPSSMRLVIKDTGVGISKADLPHVFDRFYKASHSRTSGSGSGLGLPIAKQIIEQHKGTVTISSKVNEGTEVVIQIPRARQKA